MSAKSEISRTDIFFYSLPMVMGGAMMFLLGAYLMPYATNVLAIAPGTVGVLFFISRLWDAANDPLVGHFSDLTRHPFGRRRIWIAGSAVPIALFFVMLWIPWPAPIRVVMLGLSMVLFYTVMTGLYVPHYSMGAELSADPYDRHRIYGGRAIAENIGTFIGVGLMSVLLRNEKAPAGAETVMKEPVMMSFLAMAGIFLIFTMIYRVKERRKQPGGVSFLEALKGIWHNSHARLVLLTGFFSQSGATVVMGSVVYFSAYILGQSEASSAILAVFLGVATLSIPIWVRVLNPSKKKRAWILANLVAAFSFGSCYLIEPGGAFWAISLAIPAGLAAGVIFVVHPAALADTIDYHEFQTGARSEGAYFSVFTFINKSAMGVAGIIIGAFLEYGGFSAGVEQSSSTIEAIRILFTFIPVLCFILGAATLLFYSLDIEKIEDKRKGPGLLREQ